MHSLLLLLLAASCGDQSSVPAPLALRAADDSGVFVWVADGTGLAQAMQEQGQPGRLQWRSAQGAWFTAWGPSGEALASGTRYWLPASALDDVDLSDLELRLSVGGLASAAVQPEHASLSLDLGVLEQPLVGSDRLDLVPTASLGALADGSGALEIQVEVLGQEQARQVWLDPDCADGARLLDCLRDERVERPLAAVTEPLDLPGLAPLHEAPLGLVFQATLWLDAVGADGAPARGPVAASAATETVYSLGRVLYWGDLNAKSNLSPDGCELPEDGCDHAGAYAAQDFFQNARDAGLDFVAITEQAEWGRYYPDGIDGSWVDVWDEQRRLALQADGEGLVAFVGYEWTNNRDQPTEAEAEAYFGQPYEGGHKTVLFQEIEVEPEFRVGASSSVGVVTKGGFSAYTAGENPQSDQVSGLYELLEDAVASQGPRPVLSFFHHPTAQWPQGVDFANPVSAPDIRYERLVEVFSEHGSSECIDPTEGDCNFRINDDGQRYLPRGSVQQALVEGFRVGFVAGTDSKDARPGSLEDGPSYQGNPGAPAGTPPSQQFTAGGLTGVWVDGDLDRLGLFQGLFERATVATTGPRVTARVLAIDALGRPWLPGQVLPTDVGPLRVLARVGAEGYGTERIALVQADGTVLANVTGGVLDSSVELSPASAWYLRAVLRDGAATTEAKAEHRVWISPFFTESEE